MKYGLIPEKKIFLIVSAILVIWGANEDDESIDSHDLEVFAQDFSMGLAAKELKGLLYERK